jgi:hypothetical protein
MDEGKVQQLPRHPAVRPRQIPATSNGPSPRQRFVRHHASRLSLRDAVRLAVETFFRFSHRSDRATALWSDIDQVWLGSQTYLQWAMCDASIDVPWLVADAAGAPDTPGELFDAIHAELIAYWAEQLDSLPRKSVPNWLALP